MTDAKSLQRIQTLHPVLREEARKIIEEIWDKGVGIRITSALRSPEEQDALFAIGRTQPGRVVTNAKRYQSFHNYGLAVDICLLHRDGTISFDLHEDLDKDGRSDWMECVEVFKKHQWEWAGEWKTFKEAPHFQKTFSQSWITLKGLVDSGRVVAGYVSLPNL